MKISEYDAAHLRRFGRPKMLPEEKRNNRLHVAVRSDERHAVAETARNLGITTPELVRGWIEAGCPIPEKILNEIRKNK